MRSHISTRRSGKKSEDHLTHFKLDRGSLTSSIIETAAQNCWDGVSDYFFWNLPILNSIASADYVKKRWICYKTKLYFVRYRLAIEKKNLWGLSELSFIW